MNSAYLAVSFSGLPSLKLMTTLHRCCMQVFSMLLCRVCLGKPLTCSVTGLRLTIPQIAGLTLMLVWKQVGALCVG